MNLMTAPMLPYTEEVAQATAPLYDRVRSVVPEVEWPLHAPYIHAINRLKAEKRAVILAHNYQTPEIFHCVADLVGDSLALAQQASATEAETIVLCGVHFMAETAKILNPAKRVLIPDLKAGCSLADSITADDIRALRRQYPGVPVVTYVNTSAEVKAETDVCCTSANAVEVVESLGVDRVLFLPDEFLAHYTASQTRVEIIPWKGHCEVHEQFTAEQVRDYRLQFPGLTVLAHPECPPEVLAEADLVGSTSRMVRFVQETRPSRVALITECSMSDNIAAECEGVEFVRPCTLCPHMKRITLRKIYDSLVHDQFEVTVPDDVAARARRAVERMLAVGRGTRHG
ncbi:MAG: quinolinate synthase NadA [Candidatus Eremiobacterota bacterium]